MAPQAQHQIRIGLENSTAIICDSCKNDTFVEVNYLRRVSKLLTGAPQDMVMNVPAFACSKCGHVNEQFRMPEEKKQEEKPASPIISLP